MVDAIIFFMMFSSSNVCNETLGNELFETAKYEQAFVELKKCEKAEESSGLTLGQLAVLYASTEYGKFKNKEQRNRRVFNLFWLSASKGNLHALNSLSSIYRGGEGSIDLNKDTDKAECLEKIDVPSAKELNRCRVVLLNEEE